MNPETLARLPDWPALMDLETAIAYLGGKRSVLQALERADLLRPLTARHRCRSYRRIEIDAALELARHRAGRTGEFIG